MEELAKQNAETLKPVIEHAKLVAQEKNTDGVPHFIAVAGCSAVGKSFFATELAALLDCEGIKVAILKFDDFLNPDQCDPDHFHPRFEYKRAHAVIQRILKGEKSVRKPVWNSRELRPPAKIEQDFSLDGIDLVLFEGEFTLCDDEPYDFRHYSQFGIFVDAEGDDILRWDWIRARDVEEKTQEELMANRRPSMERYREYVRSSRDSAAYLILKDRDHRYSLHKR